MYSNLISTPLDECQSWWVSTHRATRPWRHNLCTLPLVRCKTIDPSSTTSSESQESYLNPGMLPYKYSSFFPPSYGSIRLLPRQPRIFARLACWQLITEGWIEGKWLRVKKQIGIWNNRVLISGVQLNTWLYHLDPFYMYIIHFFRTHVFWMQWCLTPCPIMETHILEHTRMAGKASKL